MDLASSSPPHLTQQPLFLQKPHRRLPIRENNKVWSQHPGPGALSSLGQTHRLTETLLELMIQLPVF